MIPDVRDPTLLTHINYESLRKFLAKTETEPHLISMLVHTEKPYLLLWQIVKIQMKCYQRIIQGYRWKIVVYTKG